VRQYRHLRPRSRMPIVMLTANATAEAQRECADAGADAYLTKPATPEAVIDTLERVMSYRRLPRRLRVFRRRRAGASRVRATTPRFCSRPSRRARRCSCASWARRAELA
jgi:DNA-binding response OmpR family regulator